MKALALVLANANADQVNTFVSHRDLRTPLHLACSMINLPIAQLLLWVSIIHTSVVYTYINTFFIYYNICLMWQVLNVCCDFVL